MRTYQIERTLTGDWDVTVGDGGATWGLNGGEPCRTLDELAEFIDELEAMTRDGGAYALPLPAIAELRRQLDTERDRPPG